MKNIKNDDEDTLKDLENKGFKNPVITQDLSFLDGRIKKVEVETPSGNIKECVVFFDKEGTSESMSCEDKK